jgi:Flp pilus assembly protein TadD
MQPALSVAPLTGKPEPANTPQTQAQPDPIATSLARAEQAAQAKRMNEAIGICRDVLEQQPNNAAAMALLGSVLAHRNEMADAIALLEKACALRADIPAWHNNLSSLYRMDWRLDEAVAHGQMAVRQAPNNPAIRLNLAKALMDRGDRWEAVSGFLDVLSREPQNAEAHLAIGQILMSHGETRPGWREYEWRNRLEAAKGTLPDMVRPEWNGMALPGGTIMLIGDQGFGDTLMFARYIPLVARLCDKVVLACGSELEALLGAIPGVAATFTRWQDAPAHAVWCRLTSLGGVFDTTLDTIPGPNPYIHADPRLAFEMKAVLDAAFPSARRRVGLFWSGRPTHPNDRRRSLTLSQLAAITSVPEIDFVSIQKQVPPADAATLAAAPNILDLSARLTDFSATAAVIANLDLLISVDSAVVHLAGAMGRPVWMLTGKPADWRWLHDQDHSPWYPTLHLARQPTPGDWDTAIAAVAARLRSQTG